MRDSNDVLFKLDVTCIVLPSFKISKFNHIFSSLRFRWYQGFVPSNDYAPEWAIDNVFIGMACMDHCLGHGACSDTMMCSCDYGYQGDSCHPANSKPAYLKEDFTASDFVLPFRGDVGIAGLSAGSCK